MTFKRVWDVRPSYAGKGYGIGIQYDSLERALKDVAFLNQATPADAAYMVSYVVPA